MPLWAFIGCPLANMAQFQNLKQSNDLIDIKDVDYKALN